MKHIILLLRASLLGLLVFSAPMLRAQTIHWIQLPINTSSSPDTILGPDSLGSNPSGTWIVTNLPCYGNVLITHTFPANVTDFINPADENVPNANGNFVNVEAGYGAYSWGPCAELNFLNSSNLPETYTVNFYFLNGPPVNFSVVLAASGLGRYTTATVSQPVVFRGEYDLSSSAYTSLTNQPYNANITAGSTNGGTSGTIVGSYYNIDHSGDYINTGWALFQPVNDLQTATLPPGSGAGYPSISGPVPYLSLAVDQMSGDGIGFSLGYICLTNVCTNGCLTIYSPDDITVTTCSNSMPVNFMATVLDNCCSNCVTLTNYPPSGYNFPLGTTVVTNLATDSLGNTDICTFTVTVIQNTNPPVIFSCPTNIELCIVSNGCGVMSDFTSEVLATNSLGGSVAITQSIPPGTSICSDTDVTFTATDACSDATQTNVPCTLINCSSNCLQIICPSNIVVTTCSNCVPVFYPPATAIDPCCSNGVTLTYYPPSGSCFPLGSNPVEVTATDGCSNMANCYFTVTVLPGTNCAGCLTVQCPTNKTVTCGSAWTFDSPTATTCCASNIPGTTTNLLIIPMSTVTNSSGPCTQLITRTWVISDGCGATNVCSQIVTVVDTTPPIINCPSNIVVSSCTAVPVFYTPTATDTCSGSNVTVICSPPSGSFFAPGTTTPVACVAVDDCGNSNGCSFTVTVKGGCVPPPTNMVLWLPFDETTGPVSANIAPVADANNGLQVNNPSVVLGAYVDNSLSFNGAQYVRVADYPEIDPGTNQSFTLDAWVNRGTNGPNTPTCVVLDKRDPVSGNGYSLSVDYGHVFITLSGNNYSSGTEAVPADGQWHFIAVTVTPGLPGTGEIYIDGLPPVPFAPVNVNLVTTAPFIVGKSVYPGNQPWQGGIDEVEMYSRALTSNEIDSIYSAGPCGKCKPPCGGLSVICLTNKTVECGSTWTFDPPLATTCCPSNIVTSTGVVTNVLITSISTVTNGVCPRYITNTWLIYDGCGDTDICSQTVTVVDTTPPVVNCPTNTVVVPVNPFCQFIIPRIQISATDNCTPTSQLVYTQSPPAGTIVSNQDVLVTVTVTDLCGNSSECHVVVVGEHNLPPLVFAPAFVTVSNCLVPCVQDLVSVIDRCCPSNSWVITQWPPCNTPLGPGINSVTVTVTDCFGNSATRVIHLSIVGSESFLGSLFNTGVSNNGSLVPVGTVDPHYSLGPVPPSPYCYTAPDAFAAPDFWWSWLELVHISQWICPCPDSAFGATLNPPGNYTYTNQFVLPSGADASTASISGRWAADTGASMYFNGVLQSGNTIPVSRPSAYNQWHPFTINSGFLPYPSVNTILFVVTKGTYVFDIGPGLRVEYTNALVNCYTCAPPAIISMTGGGTRPQGSSAFFHASAAGTPLLSYQWYHNGVPLSNNGHDSGVATANLFVYPVNYADAGMYCVVVSDPCGSVTNCVQLRVVHGWPWQWGWWNIAQLDDPLAATVGPDLVLVGTNTFGIGAGSTADFGMPNPDGQIVNVMDVPPLPLGTSIQIPVIAPPGSNSVPSYSVIMDLYQPDTSAGTQSTIFFNGLNTNEPDGVAVTVDSANNLHLTGSANGTSFDVVSGTPLPTDTWSRIALVVDDPQDGVVVNLFLYLNGQPVASTTVPTSTGLPVDWSNSPPTILSAAPGAPAPNGEFYVSSVQFHAVALTSEQVAGIGSPENGAMPADDPSVGVEPVLSASMSNDVVTLTWTGSPYVLQETADLAGGQWMDSMAPFTESDMNGTTATTVRPPSPNSPAKFYRLVFRP